MPPSPVWRLKYYPSGEGQRPRTYPEPAVELYRAQYHQRAQRLLRLWRGTFGWFRDVDGAHPDRIEQGPLTFHLDGQRWFVEVQCWRCHRNVFAGYVRRREDVGRGLEELERHVSTCKWVEYQGVG